MRSRLQCTAPMYDDEVDDRQRAIERALGVSFIRPALLARALTHASRRAQGETANERLEFLGDAVMGMIVAEYLFRELPDAQEGQLTRIKSVAVSTDTLADAFGRLDLDAFVRSSRSVAEGDLPPRVRANLFEALIAAIYLDQGLETARAFVLRHLERHVRRVLHGRHAKNYKSMLQQHTQRDGGVTPVYELIETTGPSHGRRFRVCAVVDGRAFDDAWGASKKEAEQKAARLALEALQDEDEDA